MRLIKVIYIKVSVSHLPIHLGWYAKEAEHQEDIDLCVFEVNQVHARHINSKLFMLIIFFLNLIY